MTTQELLENPNLTLEMLEQNLKIVTREDAILVAKFIKMHFEKIGAIFGKAFAELEKE
jgi:hypothetical protein